MPLLCVLDQCLQQPRFQRLITGFGLEFLARRLSGPSVDRATLQLVGMVFASTLVPGLAGALVGLQQKQAESPAVVTLKSPGRLRKFKFRDHRAVPGVVTILYHAECLGAWTSFWAPCLGTLPFANKVAVDVPRNNYWEDDFLYYFDTVSRTDICSWRRHVNQKDCTEAAIEHVGGLLYSKFAHYTFTIAAIRVVKGRLAGKGMRLESSHALLKFSWLMVTLFGPCLPILNTLAALLVNIYSILLFGCDSQLLDLKETNKHAASLPSFGVSTVALLTLAFHSTNLL
eukprot:3770254-Amphidinium_carterae.1